MGTRPDEGTKTKFGIRGRVAYVSIRFKFYRNRLRSFRAVRKQKLGFPLTLTVALTTTVLPVTGGFFSEIQQYVAELLRANHWRSQCICQVTGRGLRCFVRKLVKRSTI